MNASNAPPQACMFIFSQSVQKNFGRRVRVAQKYFAPMELKSLQIWFSLPDKRLISNWFRYIVSSVTHSPFVPSLIEAARRTSSWYSSKSPWPDLTNRVISPIINVTLHRGLKIRIIRPQNWITLIWSTIRHFFFAKCAHVWRIRSHGQIRSV